MCLMFIRGANAMRGTEGEIVRVRVVKLRVMVIHRVQCKVVVRGSERS